MILPYYVLYYFVLIVLLLEYCYAEDELKSFFSGTRAAEVTPDHVCVLSSSESCNLDGYDVGDIIQVTVATKCDNIFTKCFL